MINNNDGKNIQRYDTKTNWEKFNPVLEKGELVFEDNEGTIKQKVGDGTNKYSSLSYLNDKECPLDEVQANISQQIESLKQKNVELERKLNEHDYVTRKSITSNSWYRVYKSGWVEQGGYATNIAETEITTITLPVKMKDTNYFASVTNASGKTNSDTEGVMCVGARTTTTIAITCGYINPNTSPCFWEVKGQCATQ